MSAQPQEQQQQILIAVASGSEDLIPTLIEKLRAIRPDLPLYLISEFQERVGVDHWLPYRPGRSLEENQAAIASALSGKSIVYGALILQPRMPYWNMRRLAWRLGGLRTIFFNENLDHFMLRPRSLPTIARHFWWRSKNFARWELRPGGTVYTWLWRLRHPGSLVRPWRYRAALRAGTRVLALRAATPPTQPDPAAPPPAPAPDAGVSVVIPSRNGRELLARLLPGLMADLEGIAHEVIVVDNGSDDGTAEWLAREWPQVRLELNGSPLSFARAVNRGIAAARLSHLLMLNNDMVVEPSFTRELLAPFATVPDLFCSTAQILFPPGERRQETGKAVMPPERRADEFPVTCLEPIPGEDHSYVLYGSGGCSLFDLGKLRQLGGLLETYEPAYVEDLDLGFRGWQRNWPTVFAARARVEHRHRSTTSRYYSPAELARVLEVNLLKFIAGTVTSPTVFERLWTHTINRLNLRAASMEGDPAAMEALAAAAREAGSWVRPGPAGGADEEVILGIGSGEVAVFPGRVHRHTGRPVLLVASPYLPFPLTHGGAVRMYNLLKRAARDYDLVLVCFAAGELAAPPPEVLDLCVETVMVRRQGRHDRPLTARPDTVEEFDTTPFRAAVRMSIRKWRPALAQLEYTQMAVYAKDCSGARTVLVEHDVTFDLYEQLLRKSGDWETRQQYERWVDFERGAWREVDAVVVMSEKDRATVGTGARRTVTLANGVDLERFQPAPDIEPEPRRVLFIGAFSHLPNILALEFFLREAWPRVLAGCPQGGATLHVIAGKDPEYHLERARGQAAPDLAQAGVELEGFVSDPRVAYRRAEVVIAPLLASAGTNIKIMEAMAMGRAIVSTPGGINGLAELRDGHDVLVRDTGAAMADAILELFAHPHKRREIERHARASAERHYSWDTIAAQQRELYEELRAAATTTPPPSSRTS